MTLSAGQRFWHMLTGWTTYTQPPAERVDVPRARSRVLESVPFDWPEAFRPLTISVGKCYTANRKGVGSGTPMQNGLATTRSVTWGWSAHGEQEHARVPRPASGWYWLTGHPSPLFDRHCIITAPDGSVHELIQFDPFAAPGGPPLPNQALGWGLWRDGELVDGKASTATGYASHRFIWTPWSHEDPHEQRLVLHDYVGADGALSVGPVAGTRWVVDRDSVSYAAMVALGGMCAMRAEALATWGARLIDRSGYEDASVESREVGTRPQPPSLTTQPGRQWKGTNMHRFRVDLSDLRLVTKEAA
jgi:hypothetical protein